MSSDRDAELDSFRRQWKEEVARRAQQQSHSRNGSSSQPHKDTQNSKKPSVPSSSAIIPGDRDGGAGEIGNVYHNLEGKGHGRRLSNIDFGESSKSKEPNSALDHYEQAVEKETQGALGDSLDLYRKAFRLDSHVHESYKQKHFPASAHPPKAVSHPPADASSKAPVKISSTVERSGLSASLSSLVSAFTSLRIEGAAPPTDADPAPPCPIAELPEELLVEILVCVAVSDIGDFVRLAQVCKRLAYLVAAEDRVWRRVVEGTEFGLAAMHYRYALTVEGRPLSQPLGTIPDLSESITLQSIPLTPTYPSYQQTFRSRPRIRFNGAYISTVNYTRPGASATNSLTWGSPILIVTYYRYLRFFRDGSCISLLTTTEPADVVPYLLKEHLPISGRKERGESALPSAVMKDALRGRWRLSGCPFPDQQPYVPEQLEEEELEDEVEGDIHIETEGVIPKYLYKMQLAITSPSRGAKNNKLAWKGYWSYNKLTDDWGEFRLKNDRGFWFSRVKSYGHGLSAGI